jgi:hypothetical protein
MTSFATLVGKANGTAIGGAAVMRAHGGDSTA